MKIPETDHVEGALGGGGHGHAKLSLLAAAVFIIGEVAGSGVLALPFALSSTGWEGMALFLIIAAASCQAALYLGKSWLIVEERWPEYKTVQADPYSVIGLKAWGPKARTASSIAVFLQCYGSAVVVLAICAELVFTLASDAGWMTLSSCEWIIIIGVIAIPFTWLPTPAEISWVAYTAMSATAFSCIIMLVIFGQEFSAGIASMPPIPVTTGNFFLAMSTMFFAFGGAAAFPTFQCFMADKSKFPHAVITAFIGLLVIFVPIMVGGFVLYGGAVTPDILHILPKSGLRTAIMVLMAFHVFAANLILINPINLSFEAKLGIGGQGLNWKRCLVRTWVGMSIIGVILSVPKFEKILTLVGATSVSTTSYIFPSLFYWGLTRQTNPSWSDRRQGLGGKIVCGLIGALGLTGALVGGYFGGKNIFSAGAFTKPCYVP